MSRTIKFTSRTLAITGALLAATLAAPVAGHAQAITAERTLLNLTATPSFAPGRPSSARTTPTDPGVPGSVEGARALLGRTPRERQELDRGPAAVDSPVGAPVDGERALLGQWTRAETRRPGHGV